MFKQILDQYETSDYGFGDDGKLYLKPRETSKRPNKKSLSDQERKHGRELHHLQLAGGKIRRQLATLNASLHKLKTTDIKVVDDLLEIEKLAELIGVVCEEDAPWGAPIAEPAWGRADKAKSLQALNDHVVATYESIKSREDLLTNVRKESEKVEESLNDVCSRATKIQKDLGPIRKFFQDRSEELKQVAVKAEKEALEKAEEHLKARLVYEQQSNEIKRKRENNATIFHSIGTLFSNPGEVDLAYGSGINRDEYDANDMTRLEGYGNLLGTAQANLTGTLSERGAVRRKQEEAAAAIARIEETVKAATRHCERAIKQISQLESKEASFMAISADFTELENSVESFKGQRELPTITEMSKILLSVVQSISHYAQHEPGVRAVNQRLFGLIDRYVRWQLLIEEEEDETLEKKYSQAKRELTGS